MINELFTAIDNMDASEFAKYLTDNCTFRFGNQPAISGKAETKQYVAAFFDSISRVEHLLSDVWHHHGATTCHGMVTYTRKNGSQLTAPFANVFKLNEQKIDEYLIFADTSALYEQ